MIKNQQQKREVLGKLKQGQMNQEEAKLVLEKVAKSHQQLKEESQKLLTLTNQAIQAFNKSSESQVPILNQRVSKRREILQVLHNQLERNTVHYTMEWRGFPQSGGGGPSSVTGTADNAVTSTTN